jgi:hypothetical protein
LQATLQARYAVVENALMVARGHLGACDSHEKMRRDRLAACVQVPPLSDESGHSPEAGAVTALRAGLRARRSASFCSRADRSDCASFCFFPRC